MILKIFLACLYWCAKGYCFGNIKRKLKKTIVTSGCCRTLITSRQSCFWNQRYIKCLWIFCHAQGRNMSDTVRHELDWVFILCAPHETPTGGWSACCWRIARICLFEMLAVSSCSFRPTTQSWFSRLASLLQVASVSVRVQSLAVKQLARR